jgi:solute:Na+ symporter, SSS family
MMITGITVLALAFCMPQLRAMDKPDFEKLLPIVLSQYVPIGVVGFLLAGLMAAFMSNSRGIGGGSTATAISGA